jgi:hypothetical protein
VRRTSRRSVFTPRFSDPRYRTEHRFHIQLRGLAHHCPILRTQSNPTVSSKNINPTRPHDLNPIPDRVRRKNVSGFLQTTLSKVPRNYIPAHYVVGRRGTSDKVLTLLRTDLILVRDSASVSSPVTRGLYPDISSRDTRLNVRTLPDISRKEDLAV